MVQVNGHGAQDARRLGALALAPCRHVRRPLARRAQGPIALQLVDAAGHVVGGHDLDHRVPGIALSQQDPACLDPDVIGMRPDHEDAAVHP